jgi:hypothetical protein
MRDLDRNLRAYAEYIDVLPVTASEAMRIKPARTRLQPVLAAAVAAVIVVIVVGGVAWLAERDDRPVVDTRPTLPPTTITSTTTTTTTKPTTTTEAAASIVPSISWTMIGIPGVEERGQTDASSMSIVDGVAYLTGAYWSDDWRILRGGIILRSEDGLTWERLDDPAIFGTGGQNIYGVASHEGTTVAVGFECTDNESACLAAVWISTDNGHTWERVPHQEAFGSSGLHRMLAITATDSGFLAVGDDIWTSPDGQTWTVVDDLPGNRNTIWDVVATPDLIVGVGQRWDNGSEAAIWTSPNGSEWTRVPDEDGNFSGGEGNPSYLSAVAVTPDGFAAVGAAGTSAGGGDAAAWLSTSGTRWRPVTPRGWPEWPQSTTYWSQLAKKQTSRDPTATALFGSLRTAGTPGVDRMISTKCSATTTPGTPTSPASRSSMGG